MNNAPVVLSGHRVLIAFPQETHIVRAHQLVDAGWVTTELGVIKANGPGVLQAPVDGFRFLVGKTRLFTDCLAGTEIILTTDKTALAILTDKEVTFFVTLINFMPLLKTHSSLLER